MRVRHRTTGHIGSVIGGEPDYIMGEPTWPVLWDAGYVGEVSDDDLIVID